MRGVAVFHKEMVFLMVTVCVGGVKVTVSVSVKRWMEAE